MNTIMDAGCFCGHWPYRKLRCNTVSQLTELHQKAGIAGGLVSNLSSIFYHDPLEGDAELAKALDKTSYALACNVNPALQGCEITTQRAISELSPAALRLYPTIHKYALNVTAIDRIAALAAERNIPVILTARLEDPRLDFLLRQSEPDLNAFFDCVTRNPDTRFLLSAFYPYELQSLPQPFPKNLWVDLAGCFKPLFALEQLLSVIPVDRILYASFASLKAVHATLLSIRECMLPLDVQQRITSKNYYDFLCISGSAESLSNT